MDLGPHAGFILGAYGFATLVIAGLILNALRDNRAQKRALSALQDGAEPLVSVEPPPKAVRRSLLVVLPVLTFAVLAGIFMLRLRSGADPAALPSVMIGKPVPSFRLPAVAGLDAAGKAVPGLSSHDLKGAVTVVNFFASWCAPCQVEHPMLMRLTQEPGIRLVGIDYKEKAEDSGRRYLTRLGNPFQAVGVDATGRTAIDFGVYGVPETFIVGSDGIIRDKLVGVVTPDNYGETLRKIRAAGSLAAATN